MKVSYTLSTAATVTFTLKRQAAGRKVKSRCVKATKKNHKHQACTRLLALRGKIIKTGRAGANNFVWGGSIGGQQLTPGTYRLTATPTANGQAGKPRQITFTITD